MKWMLSDFGLLKNLVKKIQLAKIIFTIKLRKSQRFVVRSALSSLGSHPFDITCHCKEIGVGKDKEINEIINKEDAWYCDKGLALKYKGLNFYFFIFGLFPTVFYLAHYFYYRNDFILRYLLVFLLIMMVYWVSARALLGQQLVLRDMLKQWPKVHYGVLKYLFAKEGVYTALPRKLLVRKNLVRNLAVFNVFTHKNRDAWSVYKLVFLWFSPIVACYISLVAVLLISFLYSFESSAKMALVYPIIFWLALSVIFIIKQEEYLDPSTWEFSRESLMFFPDGAAKAIEKDFRKTHEGGRGAYKIDRIIGIMYTLTSVLYLALVVAKLT